MKVGEAVIWTKTFYPHFNEAQAYKDLEKTEISLKKKMGKLSTGMSTMVKVILAINSGASFIILDEPTLGLDAVSRAYLYQRIIEEFGKGNQTFVLSTHMIMDIIVKLFFTGSAQESNSFYSMDGFAVLFIFVSALVSHAEGIQFLSQNGITRKTYASTALLDGVIYVIKFILFTALLTIVAQSIKELF